MAVAAVSRAWEAMVEMFVGTSSNASKAPAVWSIRLNTDTDSRGTSGFTMTRTS